MDKPDAPTNKPHQHRPRRRLCDLLDCANEINEKDLSRHFRLRVRGLRRTVPIQLCPACSYEWARRRVDRGDRL